MNELITYIESLDADFIRLQIAEGYDWQHARTVSRQKLQSDTRPELVVAADNDVAVEFFFSFAHDHEFFIGFKYDPKQLPHITAQQFIDIMLTLASNTTQPRKLLLDAGEKLFANSEIYLSRAVDRAVSLVVNYWNEVGTVTIWKAGQKPLSRTSLQQKLAHNRELRSTIKNPIALEIDYGAPALWIGFDVSNKVGPDYSLESEVVLALLQIAQHNS